MLAQLGRCEVAIGAVAGVEFRPKAAWRRWSLELVLRDGMDPYAAVGAALSKRSHPFRLTGPAKTTLLAEYWADQVRYMAGQAATTPMSAQERRRALVALVAPLPMHIQTSEGVASFDGATVRLLWSGASAGRRKRRAQRREFPLTALAKVEWAPSDGWEWGYLRLIAEGDQGETATKPKQDLTCLRCDEGKQGAAGLLLAATITAHLFADRAEATPALPSPGPESKALSELAAGSERTSELLQMLEQLRAAGVLTEAEFAAKRADLLGPS